METGQIYTLMAKVMGEVGAIEKLRKNQQQGYAFRGIDDVYMALQPALVKHGVVCVPEVVEERREERPSKNGGTLFYTTVRMAFTFYAPDGSYVRAVTSGEAMDSGDKSTNKAMSAAMKYAMLQTFCIPTEEKKDTEYESPEPAPKSAPSWETPPTTEPTNAEKFLATLREALEARGFNLEQINRVYAGLCQAKKVARLTDLPQSKWQTILDKATKGELDKLFTAKAA
jgi:hypothetical protein